MISTTSSTSTTTLTPLDLPRLVMDSPPIPAIKLPASSPPANTAAIKRHLFDSPMLSASQTEQAEQPALVTSAIAPEAMMRSAPPETLTGSATLDKANTAAIKCHLFDSPMPSAGSQTEQAKLEEALLQPTLVTRAAAPETLIRSATLDKVDKMVDSCNPLTQALTSPFTVENREGFSIHEEQLFSPPRVEDTFEQPLSSGSGYNLDFLEVLEGTDAQKLCPTSPLVVKRRESLHLLQEKADAEEVVGSKNEAVTFAKKLETEVEKRKEPKSALEGNSGGVQGQEEESFEGGISNVEIKQKHPQPLTGKTSSFSSHEYDLNQPSCSKSDINEDSEAHIGFLGPKESPAFEQPISSKGGYNLDFLEEVGAEAASLCPTSPLVIKERKRGPANVEKSASNNFESGVEAENGKAESSSKGHSSEETQHPSDKELISEPSASVDSIDDLNC